MASSELQVSLRFAKGIQPEVVLLALNCSRVYGYVFAVLPEDFYKPSYTTDQKLEIMHDLQSWLSKDYHRELIMTKTVQIFRLSTGQYSMSVRSIDLEYHPESVHKDKLWYPALNEVSPSIPKRLLVVRDITRL